MFTIRDGNGKVLDSRDAERSAYIRAIYLAHDHGRVEVVNDRGDVLYTLTMQTDRGAVP